MIVTRSSPPRKATSRPDLSASGAVAYDIASEPVQAQRLRWLHLDWRQPCRGQQLIDEHRDAPRIALEIVLPLEGRQSRQARAQDRGRGSKFVSGVGGEPALADGAHCQPLKEGVDRGDKR
jgi:hypothetical protein